MHLFLAVITAAAVWAWIVGHQLALYYIGAVLVEQLPEPTDKSGPVYRYCYSVIQILAANLKRMKFSSVPPVPSVPPPTPTPPPKP